MVLDRLPAEEHLDLLIAFARALQGIAPYEEVARSHGLQIMGTVSIHAHRKALCPPVKQPLSLPPIVYSPSPAIETKINST